MSYAISPEGLVLIQTYEGFCAEPVQMPDASWVVGYGHVRAERGSGVNEDEARALLRSDLAPFEALVNEKVAQPLGQSQFDALVSFAFSIGAVAFASSQVLRRVNVGQFVAAACAMDAWRKSEVAGDGEVVDVLVARRAAEKSMLLKEVAIEAAPSAFIRAKIDYAASILGAPRKYAPAPTMGALPLTQAKPEAGARLIEIMQSAPETDVLLLTQVVETPDVEDEITTAHAMPVARKRDHADAEFGYDPLAPAQRTSLFQRWLLALAKFNALPAKPEPRWAGLGLGALFVFGLGLTLAGGSMFLQGAGDGVTLAGGSALTVPGLTASIIGGVGLISPHA